MTETYKSNAGVRRESPRPDNFSQTVMQPGLDQRWCQQVPHWWGAGGGSQVAKLELMIPHWLTTDRSEAQVGG